MLPGSWSPPRPISPLRYRAGRLSPSTTSRWPGIGGGTGESRGVATPPKGWAYTSVIPCHFPSGAGEIQRESHPTEGLGLNAVIPLPARGVGIGWGGTPKRTRGAGAPGGGGWDWVGGYPKEDPGGRSPGGLGGGRGKRGNGYAILKNDVQKIIGGPTPPPTRWSPAPHSMGQTP